jgi:DNA-binding response OmpR family regulator
MTAGSVLLIEDSSEVRDVLTEILIRDGYKVKSADDGISAWKILNSESFDLIISDMDLPGMDGLELIANMRKNSIETPVLLTSGVNRIKKNAAWNDLARYRLLCKPFEIKEIRKAILDLTGEK